MGMSGAGWVPGPMLLQAFKYADVCVNRWKAGKYIPFATEIDGVKDIIFSGYGFASECLVKRTGSRCPAPGIEQRMRAQNIERLQKGASKVFTVPIWTLGQCSSLATRLWKVKE